VRIEAAFPSLNVFFDCGRALPHAYSAGKGQPHGAAVHSTFDAQALLAVSIDEEFGGAVAILRIEVVDPEIGGFQDVAI
jgi:hypothetical protein